MPNRQTKQRSLDGRTLGQCRLGRFETEREEAAAGLREAAPRRFGARWCVACLRLSLAEHRHEVARTHTERLHVDGVALEIEQTVP